jgi:hypothetical protein
MLSSGTDAELYITECTLVYEEIMPKVNPVRRSNVGFAPRNQALKSSSSLLRSSLESSDTKVYAPQIRARNAHVQSGVGGWWKWRRVRDIPGTLHGDFNTCCSATPTP